MAWQLSYQVTQFLLTPLAQDLTQAERVVLYAIAEHASDDGRYARLAWDSDDWTLEAVLGVTRLRQVLERLAKNGLECRVVRGYDSRDRPIYAHKGKQTTYRLPMFPTGTVVPGGTVVPVEEDDATSSRNTREEDEIAGQTACDPDNKGAGTPAAFEENGPGKTQNRRSDPELFGRTSGEQVANDKGASTDAPSASTDAPFSSFALPNSILPVLKNTSAPTERQSASGALGGFDHQAEKDQETTMTTENDARRVLQAVTTGLKAKISPTEAERLLKLATAALSRLSVIELKAHLFAAKDLNAATSPVGLLVHRLTHLPESSVQRPVSGPSVARAQVPQPEIDFRTDEQCREAFDRSAAARLEVREAIRIAREKASAARRGVRHLNSVA